MKGFPTREQVEGIKEQYPVGTRIKLLSMDDPYNPIVAGTEGIVESIDSIGTLHMSWDDGRTLGVSVFADKFEVLSKPEEPSQGMGGMSL